MEVEDCNSIISRDFITLLKYLINSHLYLRVELNQNEMSQLTHNLLIFIKQNVYDLFYCWICVIERHLAAGTATNWSCVALRSMHDSRDSLQQCSPTHDCTIICTS